MEIDGEERRWCDLPKLLLWMVMDRQHYVDRERVGFVCKDWKLARQSYRPPPSRSISSPWVFHRSYNDKNIFTIFNPITMESFTLGLGPLFDSYPIVSSKKGWVLFQGNGKYLFPVTLFNILTGATLTMPSPHITSSSPKPQPIPAGCIASFSAHDDGTPWTVAFAYVDTKKFYVGDVRSRTWTTHTVADASDIGTRSLLVAGNNKLYALDHDGILLIYHILTRQWTLVPPDHTHFPEYDSLCGLAQSENGDILKIEPACLPSPLFHISKLNATETGWDQILPHHQPSFFNSWYLSKYGCHFVTTNQQQVQDQDEDAATPTAGADGGIKIYAIQIPPGETTNATVIVHDFKNSTQRPITDSPPPPIRHKWLRIRWIDLGPIETVPPSCLRYHPGTQTC